MSRNRHGACRAGNQLDEVGTLKQCRSCGKESLSFVISLGRMPLANAFLTRSELEQAEDLYPLDLVFCTDCTLAQITETIPAEKLFRKYLYFSSFSETLLMHASKLVEQLVEEYRLNRNSFVVEIASNDGYLLQYYRDTGVPVLGIEPAVNIAKVARDVNRIPTLAEFFNRDLAENLRNKGQAADVIHAHNVLAHVSSLNDFVEGVAILLKDDGIGLFEVPYLLDIVDNCEFDTIYHEHLCFFSFSALCALFSRHGLEIQDVRRIPIHGGSLRLVVGHSGAREPATSVNELLSKEDEVCVSGPEMYREFASRVETLKATISSALRDLKTSGHSLAAYGASAKATVLLNYCRLGTDVIDYIVDKSPQKVGRYVPGVHLPIYGPERLLETRPDYTLLTVWNIADEILRQQKQYRDMGGRFIRPIPELTIL